MLLIKKACIFGINTVLLLLDRFDFGWDQRLRADPHVYLVAYKLNETGNLLTFYRDSL